LSKGALAHEHTQTDTCFSQLALTGSALLPVGQSAHGNIMPRCIVSPVPEKTLGAAAVSVFTDTGRP
jgi:hypothetical protein